MMHLHVRTPKISYLGYSPSMTLPTKRCFRTSITPFSFKETWVVKAKGGDDAWVEAWTKELLAQRKNDHEAPLWLTPNTSKNNPAKKCEHSPEVEPDTLTFLSFISCRLSQTPGLFHPLSHVGTSGNFFSNGPFGDNLVICENLDLVIGENQVLGYDRRPDPIIGEILGTRLRFSAKTDQRPILFEQSSATTNLDPAILSNFPDQRLLPSAFLGQIPIATNFARTLPGTPRSATNIPRHSSATSRHTPGSRPASSDTPRST
ncbi:hypothetical protein LXL04_004173 [Taraxacum kok-saghyz]